MPPGTRRPLLRRPFSQSMPHVEFTRGFGEITPGTLNPRKPARRGFWDILRELFGFGRKPPMQPHGPPMQEME